MQHFAASTAWKVVLLCCWLCSVPSGQTEPLLPKEPAYNVRLDYFADQTGAVALADLTQPALQSRFKPLPDLTLSAGYSQAVFWLRLTIDSRDQNLTANDSRRFIGFANPLIQSIQCFQWVEGAAAMTALGATGSLTPIDQRSVISTGYYIPFTMLPVPQQLFCRLTSMTSISVPVLLLTEQEARARQQLQHLWFGFVGGLLILLIALNVFVAIATRTRANALYAINLFCLLLLFCAVTGVGPAYLWVGWGAQLSWLVPLSLIGIALTSYLFCQHFFVQHRFAHWQLRTLSTLAWFSLLLLPLCLALPYAYAAQLAIYNALLMVVVLLVAAMLAWRQQMTGARIFLAGRLLVCAGGLIQFIKTQGLIPAFEVIEHVLFLAAIAEGVLLSVSLAMQNRRLEQEKQLAAQQLFAGSEQSLQAQQALNERLTAEIAERRQTEQVQKVLFQISELSVDKLELYDFLQKIQQEVSTLLFANNFYVALYDRQQDAVRFPYMVDEVDAVLPAPDEYIPASKLQGSWTMWILQHGEPLFGDAQQIAAKTGLAPRFGAVARCWLGFPLFNSTLQTAQSQSEQIPQAFGVLCLQIYDEHPPYSRDEYRLLEYVSRHISQALLRRQYRADLEATVAERTAAYRSSVELLSTLNQQLAQADVQSKRQLSQIKNLLDNTGQGFLSCDTTLQVLPEYSQECCQIFNQPQLAGDICTLLAHSDSALRQLYHEVLSEVLNTELPEGMSNIYLSLLPQQQQYFSRSYRLEYKKIGPGMLLVIISNITETLALQQALQQQQQDAAFVVYCLTHEAEVRQTLAAFDRFLQQQLIDTPNWTADDESRLFRDLHTFKGLLAQIQCPQLPADIHLAEEQLLQHKQQAGLTDDGVRRGVWAILQPSFAKVRTMLQQHLGTQFLAGEQQLKVPASLVRQVCQLLSRSHPELVLQLRQTEFKSVADLLAGHIATAKRLALSQQKELAVQTNLDIALWLDGNFYQPLFAVLLHLFRNSVDHGCEIPAIRIAQDKPAVATLRISAQLAGGACSDDDSNQRRGPAQLLLLIQDDGQGIALDLVRQQIIARGLLSQEEVLTLDEAALLNFVFAEHFSTKQDVSEISGRGVGLAAVRQGVELYGGQITVSTTVGQGSCFQLTIPLRPDYYIIKSTGLAAQPDGFAPGAQEVDSKCSH